MVSDNRDRVWGALEVLLPFRECQDNSKEFPVIDVIVSFGWGEHLREVSIWLEITICVFLHKDSASSKQRGIRHDMEWAGDIWDGKDRGGGKDCFESVKGSLVNWHLRPSDIFMGESSKRSDDV